MAHYPPLPQEMPEELENAMRPSRSEIQPYRRGFPLRHLRSKIEYAGESLRVLDDVTLAQKNPFGSLIILWGQRGSGKTQIAVNAALSSLSWKNEWSSPMYRKASDIFREIRSAFRKESIVSEMEVISGFSKPFILVIDEAQERGETEFEDRTLTHIIDKRYDSMLHTIIISNLKKDELAKSLGPSIISRVHESGMAIECNWPSFREKP